MSDNWIRIIPRDPHFVPTADAIAHAEALMQQFAPAAEEVTSEVSEKPVFRDCGANLERVFCPLCQTDLPSDWWTAQMGDGYVDDGFDLHPVQLPCGHTVASLNELGYDWDQGFSRYLLDAMNPGVGEHGIAALSEEQRQQFEDALGCKVKVIYQHL